MKCIEYNDGYKYQLKETYSLPIEIQPDADITTPFIRLDTRGNLTLVKGMHGTAHPARPSTPSTSCADRWPMTPSTS